LFRLDVDDDDDEVRCATGEQHDCQPQMCSSHSGNELQGYEVNAVSAKMKKSVDQHADRHGLDQAIRNKLIGSNDDAVGRVVSTDLSSRVRNPNGYVRKMLRKAEQAVESERHGWSGDGHGEVHEGHDGNGDGHGEVQGGEAGCHDAATDVQEKEDVHTSHDDWLGQEAWQEGRAEERYHEHYGEADGNDDKGWYGDNAEHDVSWHDDGEWQGDEW
jgi:hypothetical protein